MTRKDPLAVALVLINLSLAGLLIHRRFLTPAAEPAAPVFGISGTIKLAPGLKEPWPKGAAVFVIARAEEGGPPYAVRRYDGAVPPFSYDLGPVNAMMPGAPVPERVLLSVRVDQDGDARTRQLGDLESGPTPPVPPQGTVDLTVDRPATLAP